MEVNNFSYFAMVASSQNRKSYICIYKYVKVPILPYTQMSQYKNSYVHIAIDSYPLLELSLYLSCRAKTNH